MSTANVSLGTPTNAKRETKGPVNPHTGNPVAPIVQELTEHVCKKLLQRREESVKLLGHSFVEREHGVRVPTEFGFPLEDRALRQKLWHRQGWLNVYASQCPRNEGESIDDYCSRLAQGDGGRAEFCLNMVANIAAHFELQERERREREAAERKAEQDERLSHHLALKRDASPDQATIDRLLGTIEAAGEAESLLASIMDALSAHRKAQEARRKLQEIYDSEQGACAQLGKTAPKRDAVPTPPQGAVDFDVLALRANAHPPRIYSDAGASPPMRAGR